jgi:hypothetical protein
MVVTGARERSRARRGIRAAIGHGGSRVAGGRNAGANDSREADDQAMEGCGTAVALSGHTTRTTMAGADENEKQAGRQA